jgi:stress response protein YsnF
VCPSAAAWISAPPVREEGDVTIMPVIEEIVVVERQLILKEEIHIRQVHATEKYRETVVVREQDAMISRGEAESLADESLPNPREYPQTLCSGE